MQYKLLVVDDDPLITATIVEMIPDNWTAICYNSINNVNLIENYHCAFVDMHLSNDLNINDGSQFIRKIKVTNPKLDVLAISGDLNEQTMTEALESGANRYIAKPLNQTYIQAVLKQIESYFELIATSQRSVKNHSDNWIGKSEVFLNLTRQIAQFKHEPGPILIEGETGTGKEVAAQLLRSEGNKPFIAINVAEVPESLFESEFFGHVKGSFTGAHQDKMGLIEAADGGDLFIDEIEALAPQAQVKLLRFLQEGEIRRVGSQQVNKVNVRVLIATNKNLEEMVAKDLFREDLLWRINGKKIEIPPLRDRSSDIQHICNHFLKKLTPFKTISKDALTKLQNHSWPGNIRELKRACEKIVSLSPLPIIRAEDVENYVILTKPIDTGADSDLTLQDQLKHVEKSIIERTLQKYQNVETVCKKLDISRSSLYKKIKDYDINWK